MQILRGRTGSIGYLAVSPDSRYVAVGGDRLHVWDLERPKERPRALLDGVQHGWQDFRFQFLTSSELFVWGNDARRYYRFDFLLGTEREVSSESPRFIADPIVHSESRRVKFVTDLDGSDGNESGWFVATLRLTESGLEDLSPPVEVPGSYPGLVGFTPDGGHYLAITATDDQGESYTLYDSVTDAAGVAFGVQVEGEMSRARSWTFAPDGRNLFVIDGHRLVRYECAAGGEPVVTVPVPDDTHTYILAVHPGGLLLATVEGDRVVVLRDAETLHVIRRYDFGTPTVTCVAFTPDGTRCVVGNSRGKVLLFDVDE